MPMLKDADTETKLRIMSHARDLAIHHKPDGTIEELQTAWAQFAFLGERIFQNIDLERAAPGSRGRGDDKRTEPRSGGATERQVNAIRAIGKGQDIHVVGMLRLIRSTIGKEVNEIRELTKDEASKVIDALKAA